MIVVAAAGSLLNGGIMWGLRGAQQNDLNIRSAFVHMLGDLLGSIGIIAGRGASSSSPDGSRSTRFSRFSSAF